MYSPVFTITSKILSHISSIETSRALIDRSPLIPNYEVKFQQEAIVRSVHHGTHIEGNELNYTEAEAVLEGKEINARPRDIQEIINYRNVLSYIGAFPSTASNTSNSSNSSVVPISEQVIKKIHEITTNKILADEITGVYRKTQVVIKNSLTGEISFRPPAAIEVPFLMEEFVEWLNSGRSRDIHPVLRAGIVHYEIARIHPFLDGNGRVARATATLSLFRDNYDTKKFFSLEEYFDRDASRYYEALQSVNHPPSLPASPAGGPSSPSLPSDLTYWLEYFSEGLSIEMNKIREKVEKLSRDLKIKREMGGQVSLTARQLDIVDYIQKTGELQYKAFKELFPMVSDDVVLHEVQDLTKKGVIKKLGSTRCARYVLVNS